MRTGPQVGQISCTLEIETGLSCSAMPPFDFWLGRMCFFTIMTCSTRTLPLSGNTRSTRPCLPLSRPLNTFTMSLRRISTLLCTVAVATISLYLAILRGGAYAARLYNFRRQRHNLQKLFLAQFPCYRAKDARSYWFSGFIDQHSCILIKADVGTVPPPIFFSGT